MQALGWDKAEIGLTLELVQILFLMRPQLFSNILLLWFQDKAITVVCYCSGFYPQDTTIARDLNKILAMQQPSQVLLIHLFTTKNMWVSHGATRNGWG